MLVELTDQFATAHVEHAGSGCDGLAEDRVQQGPAQASSSMSRTGLPPIRAVFGPGHERGLDGLLDDVPGNSRFSRIV